MIANSVLVLLDRT